MGLKFQGQNPDANDHNGGVNGDADCAGQQICMERHAQQQHSGHAEQEDDDLDQAECFDIPGKERMRHVYVISLSVCVWCFICFVMFFAVFFELCPEISE